MYESKAGAAARRPRFFVADTIAVEPEYRQDWLAMGEYCVRVGGIDGAAVARRIQGLSIRTSGPPANTSGKTSGRAGMRN